jgi:hypothetical protein
MELVMADESVHLVAAGDLDVEDCTILARLAGLVDRADPMPSGLVDRIRAAVAVETMQDDLIELLASARPLEAVRSGASRDRTALTFVGGEVSVVLSFRDSGEALRVDGWIAPADAWLVDVQQETSSWSVDGAEGRFAVDGLSHGPLRVVARREQGVPRGVVCRADV